MKGLYDYRGHLEEDETMILLCMLVEVLAAR